MMQGTVKWFSDSKGIGFIEPDGGGEDVFLHFSALQMEGFKTVRPGQRLRFELRNGPKGLYAEQVQALPRDDGGEEAPQSDFAALS